MSTDDIICSNSWGQFAPEPQACGAPKSTNITDAIIGKEGLLEILAPAFKSGRATLVLVHFRNVRCADVPCGLGVGRVEEGLRRSLGQTINDVIN